MKMTPSSVIFLMAKCKCHKITGHVTEYRNRYHCKLLNLVLMTSSYHRVALCNEIKAVIPPVVNKS